MQIFLFVALAISLATVVFALQNVVPVTVTLLTWTFQGSLALVLIVAFVVGAFVSFLASLPTLIRQRWASTQLKKQVASLESSLDAARRELTAVRGREATASAPSAPQASPAAPGSTLEPSA